MGAQVGLLEPRFKESQARERAAAMDAKWRELEREKEDAQLKEQLS
jgi:hypothetical protein